MPAVGVRHLTAELSPPPSFFQLAIALGEDRRFAAFQLVQRRDVAAGAPTSIFLSAP